MTYLISDSQVFNDVSLEVVKNGFPSGCYTAQYDSFKGQTSLIPFTVSSDVLVDFPESTYTDILSEVRLFFQQETKDKFDKYGFIYKKALLLHGKPGTGKTCIVVKLLQTFLENFKNGVALFNPDLRALDPISDLSSKQTPMLVIFEEFDDICQRYNEGDLLSLLDGEIQRPNTFYIFTTNFLDKIPKRLFRPGRISNVVEVGLPSIDNRKYYLSKKIPDISTEILNQWAEDTNGLTLDDLKYSVLAVQCLDIPLNQVIQDLKRSHELLDNFDGKNSNSDFDDFTQAQELAQALRGIASYVRKK